MDPYGAYGAAKAGTPFDPIAFIKNPQVIVRFICWIFAIIVFGSISSQGWYEGRCQYNGDANACRFGTTIGVFAFLACTLFLLADARFESLTNVKDRKHVVMADLGFSGFWTFLWFICFCKLSNSWRKTPRSLLPPLGYGRNNVQAAITFALFSTITWGILTYLAYRRYKIGTAQAFAPSYNDDPGRGTPGTLPGGGPAPYPGMPGPTFNPSAYTMAPPVLGSGPINPGQQTDFPAPVY